MVGCASSEADARRGRLQPRHVAAHGDVILIQAQRASGSADRSAAGPTVYPIQLALFPVRFRFPCRGQDTIQNCTGKVMKAQSTMHKVVKTLRLIIVASVVGMWMLLFGLFVQALGPGKLSHDVETVLATRPPPTEAVAPVAIANTSRSASRSFRQERERHLLMQGAAKKGQPLY